MHSIVLLTAMTATSGLFGGHHGRANSCGAACGRPARVAYAPVATCRTGNCGTASYAPAAHYGYAPAPYAAPQHVAAPAPTTYMTSNYYAPASSCATGNCPRR